MTESTQARLPQHTIPIQYDLTIVPDMEAFTFQGHVLLRVNIVQVTSSLTLNSHDLIYPLISHVAPRVSIRNTTTGQLHHAVALQSDEKNERVTFDFGRTIETGQHEVSIVYNGILNDQLCGFYRSQYESDGKKSTILCTQFEATDCRRALPCFDEPALKAVFNVTMIVPPQYQCISNMPILSQTTTKSHELETTTGHNVAALIYPANWTRFKYYPSPIMSTYLLAFIVGEFDYISAMSSSGVEVRVYTRPKQSHLGEFSLSTAVKALDYYNEYTGIPYPLPKMDLISVPDFAAGAMENWGAITYRETALLIDPLNSSQIIKTRVARTVCHEIAHMWFGNLSTMSWWSYLWLNEGFARFMEHLAVDHIFPKWQIFEQFVSDIMGSALALDALESSHPIEVPVNFAHEVNEIFDTISYAKGSCVIRMLYLTIGADNFRKGLHHYLSKFAYSNTESRDLWNSFSEISGLDISSMMQQWVSKIGYPIIMLQRSADGRPHHYDVRQERYLATYDTSKDLQSTVWSIPISVAFYKPHSGHVNSVVNLSLNQLQQTVQIQGEGVLKFNFQSAGFFRVQYSNELFHALLPHISHFSAIDRLNIQRDTFSLAASGRLPITVALGMLPSFKHEMNYAVLTALTSNLHYLNNLHSSMPYISKLKQLFNSTFQYQYDQLGWVAQPNEDSLTGLLRACIISFLGTVSEHPHVIATALELFNKYIHDPIKHNIVADLKSCVYYIVARKGSSEQYEALKQIYRVSEMQEEKNRILSVLGLVSDDANPTPADQVRLQQALNFAFSDEVRSNVVSAIVGSIGSSAHGRDLLWQYFTSHFNELQAKYMQGQNFVISGILNGMLSGHSTLAKVEEFEAFFQQHPISNAVRVIKQLSEAIRTKANRLQRETHTLNAFLQ